MKLIYEKLYPTFAGTAAAACSLGAFHVGYWPTGEIEKLFEAGLEIGAIAIGFLATAQAILMSIDERQIITRLKSTGHYAHLVSYTFGAVRWWAVLMLFCIAGVVLGEMEQPTSLRKMVLGLSAGASVAAVLSWVRVFQVFHQVLTHGPLSTRANDPIQLDVKKD